VSPTSRVLIDAFLALETEVDKNPMGTYILQGRQLGVLLNKLENLELYVEYLTNIVPLRIERHHSQVVEGRVIHSLTWTTRKDSGNSVHDPLVAGVEQVRNGIVNYAKRWNSYV